MKQKSLLTVVVVFLILLAIGGAVWYGKTKETFKESQKQPIETNNQNQTPAVPKESQEATIDTSDWKEYQAKDLGISFKLPKEWIVDTSEAIDIRPKGTVAGENSWFISLGTFIWPDRLENKVGKEFSIFQIFSDENLGYKGPYTKLVQDNSLKEVSLSLGNGVEYLKNFKRFRSYDEPDGSPSQSKEFLVFSPVKNTTYLFMYDYFVDDPNPAIDQIFQEIVRSARLLP